MGVLADALVSRGGYNRTDAQNAENGPRAADLSREFLGGSSGGGGSSYSVPDPVETARKLHDFTVQSNAPAIASLQGQIPEIAKTFQTTGANIEAQRKPLEDRYQALLSSIKTNQTDATNRQTITTQNELGRRGIQGGGLAEQTLTSALNPITSQYSNLYSQTGAAHEGDVQNLNALESQLPNQQAEAQRAVQNAIAQLQSGNPEGAISGALNYGNTAVSAQQASSQNQIAQQQLALQQQEQAFNQKYITIPGYGIYDTTNKQVLNGLNGAGGNGIQMINGVPYVNQ